MQHIVIGRKIKEIRKQNGLTQYEFSEKLGISRSHIANIERGSSNASKSLIKLISGMFDINEKWLID